MIASEVSTKRNLLIPAVVVIALVVLVGGGVLFLVYQKHHQTLGASTNQSGDVISEVGKLMVLPSGEEPQLATVSDVTKLSGQPFFAKAQDGDKVLIYSKAKEAILYRPSINKIINVAPIDLAVSSTPAPSSSASPSSSPTSTKTYDVIIYNGTTVTGLGSKTKTTLDSKVSNVNVTAVHDAVSSTYTKTLVVDLTGGNSAEASTIAKALGGSVGPLPAGENKPSGTDIIVIVGQ